MLNAPRQSKTVAATRVSPGLVFVMIVLAQFCGTSLWFAGNAIVVTLQSAHSWPANATGTLTIAVQAGFILGTLIVTLTGMSDRMSPSRLFFMSSIGGAIMNLLPVIDLSSYGLCLVSRLLTGVFLGGIYPVGMKIAADWREHGLGDWLGALVGALVIGTALPHALRASDVLHHPEALLPAISGIALTGGLLLYVAVPDGPFRKPSARFHVSQISSVLKAKAFRAPLFGYFGHMWELYTFWALVPWIVFRYNGGDPDQMNSWITTSLIIGSGGLGCWAGGKISLKTGSHPVARAALFVSGLCCLASPLLWTMSPFLFYAFMFAWGISVVADSPQFSTLIAANAPAQTRGTALTFATCAGFSITIVSIQALSFLRPFIHEDFLLCFLAAGPVFGLVFGTKPR